MNEKKAGMSCVDCHVVKCKKSGDDGKYPDFCLTTHTEDALKKRAQAILMQEKKKTRLQWLRRK